MRASQLAAISTLVLTSLVLPAVLEAQGAGDGARQSADQQAIRCVFTDAECIAKAAAEGKPVHYTDAEGNRTDAEGLALPATDLAPGEGAWANYDFVPGDVVLFYDDFSADRVGNFPRRLEFLGGNLELVEWEGRRLLRSTSAEGRFAIQLPESLPERYTIEFAFYSTTRWGATAVMTEPWDREPGAYPGSYVSLHGEVGVLHGAGGPQALVATPRHGEALTAVRIMVDGSYIKMYLDEERVANIPNATLNRSDRPTFIFGGDQAHPAFLGEIRIAAGGAPIYDALLEDGRVRLHGILFETGSARIRPESTPTLLEIGEMLERNAELRLSIEGHTDSVGDAEANQALSEARAAAVRSYLVGSHGIDAGRLEAVGFGETQPVDSNATPEGRQNNRRVELVRM